MTTFPRQIFVTGTDTDVGKTVVSAILLAGLKGTYWKPVQSGLEGVTDTEWVRQMTGLPEDHFIPETYRLKRPLSPHVSAALEGIRIDLGAFSIPKTSNHLIVEGAGGVMVPLNEHHFMLDLMIRLALPVLLVARTHLGTINHTLLSLEQLRRHRLDVFGIVMNGPSNPDNRQAIEHYGKVSVIAEVEPLGRVDPKALRQAFNQHFG